MTAARSVPYAKIQDYGLIGDGRSAALVSNRGSIDWLCWPRFDSDSIFAAIVDTNIGGHWSIRPTRNAAVSRRYLGATNVLETTFAGEEGKVVLTDFMPVTSETGKRVRLWPEHEILRLLTCIEGEVGFTVEFRPRLDFGLTIPKIRNQEKLGWRIDHGAEAFVLRSDVALGQEADGLFAQFRIKRGDRVAFSFSFSSEAPEVIPALGELADEKLRLTLEWWESWVAQSTYRGKYQPQVTRSALVLKLLSYAPSGAIIAAPTTSLPERIGGDMNWDYRFAWLRDASFTAHALFGLGYKEDAAAFCAWLLHATRLTRPKLRVVYDVFGERPPSERTLANLNGYAGSRPVRVGNAASDQLQLDLYGEVIEAVFSVVDANEKLDHDTQKMLRQFGEYVCLHWHENDNGIWEERDARRPYVHSRLLCWVALDRLLKMAGRGQIRRLSVEKFEKEKGRIADDIKTRGWNPDLCSYVQFCGGDSVDATAFLLAYHGFEEAASARMQQTHALIRERLVPRAGLVYRYEQSKTRGEGAFVICSFWESCFLTQSGKREKARESFEAALSYGNDLDLFAEEIDPQTGDALGNFPQAFTHLGLISAALALHASAPQD